jgi:hypothetical protein
MGDDLLLYRTFVVLDSLDSRTIFIILLAGIVVLGRLFLSRDLAEAALVGYSAYWQLSPVYKEIANPFLLEVLLYLQLVIKPKVPWLQACS